MNSLFVHGIKLFGLNKYKYIKCGNSKCGVCPFSNENPFIKFNDFIIPLQSNSSCNSKDIIYIIICNLCNSLYIGQSQSLKKRMTTHIRGCTLNIKDYSSCVCVVNHFNLIGHKASQNFEFVIFKSNISVKWSRLNLETQLINLALKQNVKLINILIPNLFYWKKNDKLFEFI